MLYTDFRKTIETELRRTAAGLTWSQMRSRLNLPYDRPCPTWTKQLESEIGLRRVKGEGRSLVWKIGKSRSADRRRQKGGKLAKVIP
jgi:hypothetical protein